jgi:hypothetical protein
MLIELVVLVFILTLVASLLNAYWVTGRSRFFRGYREIAQKK